MSAILEKKQQENMLVGGIWVECIYKNKLFAKDIFTPDSKQLCIECLRPSTLDPL